MGTILLVGIGGFLGANARYLLDQWVTNRWPMFFPWGTFIINLSGSFILGFFMAFAEQRPWISRETRLLFAVGFVGAYTTFSTYTYQSLRLAQKRSDGASGALCSCQRDARLDRGLRRFRAGKLDVAGTPEACMLEPAPRPLAWSEDSQQLAQRLFTKSIDRVPLGADDRDAAIANSCMLGARVGVGREVTLDKPDAVACKKIFCAPARLASVTGEDFDIHLAYPVSG